MSDPVFNQSHCLFKDDGLIVIWQDIHRDAHQKRSRLNNSHQINFPKNHKNTEQHVEELRSDGMPIDHQSLILSIFDSIS